MTNKQKEKNRINRNVVLLHIVKSVFVIALLMALPSFRDSSIIEFIVGIVLLALGYGYVDNFLSKKIADYKDRELKKLEE